MHAHQAHRHAPDARVLQSTPLLAAQHMGPSWCCARLAPPSIEQLGALVAWDVMKTGRGIRRGAPSRSSSAKRRN